MAKIYLRQIIEGKMSIGDVPLRWREDVAALLEVCTSEGAQNSE